LSLFSSAIIFRKTPVPLFNLLIKRLLRQSELVPDLGAQLPGALILPFLL
jgi:hypothetical protein